MMSYHQRERLRRAPASLNLKFNSAYFTAVNSQTPSDALCTMVLHKPEICD